MRGPRPSRPSRRAKDDGFVLMALLALLVMGGLYFLVSNMTPEAMEVRRQEKTNAALVEARDALIGYALKYREDQINDGQPDRVYGYLPLPDLGYNATISANDRNNNAGCPGEGCDAANAKPPGSIALNYTVIGRFPWRLLGTGPIRDSDGECLWYAVSGSHQRQQRVIPMNWDTPGQLDLVTVDSLSNIIAANLAAHERPVAIIFSPGPALSSRNRSSTADVAECGGNYTVSDYLDVNGLGPAFTTTNQASGDTSVQPKPLGTHGKISSNTGVLLANDTGVAITGDDLFGALRKSSLFRLDINSMLDRMTTCIRDTVAAGGAIPPAKIPGDACYDDTRDPQGYFSNYRDLLFAASGAFTGTVDGVPTPGCAGVLIFAGQRQAGQQRSTPAERATVANYLEAPNALIFDGGGGFNFAGSSQFARVSATQAAHQDIVRCIPAGASLTSVESTALTLAGFGQLSGYDPATRTLTLGALGVNTDVAGAPAKALFGCSWTPEKHTLGNGLRSYFQFRIVDDGEGFTFAIIDGERNSSGVCGAAQQHLGYSGNNTATAAIGSPKIGIEIDTGQTASQKAAFNPAAANTLANGRSDPNYTGGHVGIVYWGGESPFATGNSMGTCNAPKYWSGACYLPQEEDDNVHGLPTPPDASPRPSPRNPVAPAAPATPPAGVYKLDPSLSQIPINRDIHVRVEFTKVASTTLTPVRVATQSNINLTGPGASLDGIAMAIGDRVLAMGQSAPAENGIYTWNGASSAMTRSADANSAAALREALAQVTAGTHAGTSWRQTAAIPVLGTDAISWAKYVDRYLVEAWILADSVTVANQIIAMKTTTRPMSQLYASFTPHLRDSPVIYDIQGGACPCSASQFCGADNICYTKAFQSARLGFTNSQSTAAKDQIINISNFGTTWLP